MSVASIATMARPAARARLTPLTLRGLLAGSGSSESLLWWSRLSESCAVACATGLEGVDAAARDVRAAGTRSPSGRGLVAEEEEEEAAAAATTAAAEPEAKPADADADADEEEEDADAEAQRPEGFSIERPLGAAAPDRPRDAAWPMSLGEVLSERDAAPLGLAVPKVLLSALASTSRDPERDPSPSREAAEPEYDTVEPANPLSVSDPTSVSRPRLSMCCVALPVTIVPECLRLAEPDDAEPPKTEGIPAAG
jgi:hypothetical protein